MNSNLVNKTLVVLTTIIVLTPLFANAASSKSAAKERINIVTASCTGWVTENQGLAAVNEYLANGFRLVSVVSLVGRTNGYGVDYSDNLCAYYLTKE